MVDLDVQKIIKTKKLDGMLLVKGNYFMGETPVCGRNIVNDLTGYNGGGILLVTKAKKYLFVSTRDELQAKNETKGISVKLERVSGFLRTQKKKLRIGYDPLEHPKDRIEFWQQYAVMVKVNIPALPFKGKETNFPLIYAGKKSSDKIKDILKKMEGDYLLISVPTDLDWLLNKRGNANPFVPFIAAFGLLSKQGKVEIFKDLEKLKERLNAITGKIEMDPSHTSIGIEDCIKNPIRKTSIISKEKWIKNKTELQHIRQIGKVEDKVLRVCLSELKEGLTELDIVKRLQELRKKEKTYKTDSFPTIAAFGAHAAAPHYEPDEKTSIALKKSEIVLIDTGGQYLKGTTDMTTTVCFGTPTQKQKEMYTVVLKAHITFAQMLFPQGTTLRRLDPIVRHAMWQEGVMDYPHGTSHGIGFYGDVHEGSPELTDEPLKPGMILSNEPGFYQEGAFGIRIENMMEVVKKGKFIGFKLLTHTPLDEKLIVKSMLSEKEKAWLGKYPK